MAALEKEAQQTPPAAAAGGSEPGLPYHVTVKAGDDEQDAPWIAAVDELSGCEAGGATPDEAVENLREAMESWLSAAAEDRRVIPTRKRGGARRKHGSAPSGRFLVRMPSDLHEELTRAAEREHVSLNRFVTTQLAASVSPEPAATEAETAPSQPEPTSAPEDTQPTPGEPRPEPERSFRMLLAANLAVVVLAAAAAIALLVLALERGL